MRRLIVLDIAITNELLVALLLLHAGLLLLHCAHLVLLFILLTLTFGFLLLDPLLLFLFTSAIGILLLLATSFLFGALALLLSLGFCCLFLRSFGLHLLAHGLFLLLLSLSGSVVGVGSATATTEDLLHMRCRVDTCRGSTEHGLKEYIGPFWFVTSNHFGWLHINLFANYELRQLDELYKESYLGIFLSDTFSVELLTGEKSGTKVSRGHRCSENIVQISERRLRKKLLGHLRLLEDLLIHLSGWLPKIVTHISITMYSNFFNYK